MTLIPILLVPIVFAMGLWRLWQIPRALRRGELRLATGGHGLLRVATLAAYVLLFGATLVLPLVALELLRDGAWSGWSQWTLIGCLLLYPLCYLVAAWVFFYGLQRCGRQ